MTGWESNARPPSRHFTLAAAQLTHTQVFRGLNKGLNCVCPAATHRLGRLLRYDYDYDYDYDYVTLRYGPLRGEP